MAVMTQGSSREERPDEWFGEHGRHSDVSTMLEKGSVQRWPSGLLKGRQTPWPCGLLHSVVKEVRDGMMKINPYNLPFLFKSFISNVFCTYFFPELLASSNLP